MEETPYKTLYFVDVVDCMPIREIKANYISPHYISILGSKETIHLISNVSEVYKTIEEANIRMKNILKKRIHDDKMTMAYLKSKIEIKEKYLKSIEENASIL